MSFDQSSTPIVQLAWERLLGFSDGSFAEAARTSAPQRLRRVTEKTDLAMFVRIFGLGVLIGPDWFLERASTLADDELSQHATLLSLGLDHGAQGLGAAELLVADDLEVIDPDQELLVSLEPDDASRLCAACPPDDVNESGLAEMSDRFSIMSGDDPIATSGYQEWRSLLAHLGLLVKPELRRAGYGLAAAGIAAHEALGAGLIPQWRASKENEPSRALALKLGFVPIGTQTTIRLLS
ncbi:hypothetical protein FHU41_001537 [Psychromicrobium silvestre]|uniref:N-acetyltransferase domain-containing protein n=1 Tax=Psychromicrobium silvestre TaxID=1645614 RepID=A0A7Y9S7T1_9MICC|nr:GNAT family N-acetyltransferase [Psychromicrobium silvestre]NYE95316.1 hypothetical protein [Psychromicrobium silvestre]